MAPYRPSVRILFVCTGILCRSPVAERLATSWARQSLVDSPELADVEILSAGLEAMPGRAMDPDSARALVALGGEPAGFRAQLFTSSLAERADLVLTMTRNQRRAVLATTPRGLRRTFTLTEAADLLGSVDWTSLPLLPLAQRARELGRRLDAARSHRLTSNGDDVPDPIGRRASVHDEVAGTIATALRPLADVVLSSVRVQLPRPVPA